MDLTHEQQSQLYLAIAGLITAAFAVFLVWARAQARKALERLAKLTNSPELLAQADNFDRVVTTSILYVREQAQKLAKGLIVTGPRTPEEKLKLAEATARSIAPDAMKSISSEHFAVLAEAKLHSVRPLLADPVTVAMKSMSPRVSTNPAAAEIARLPAIPKAAPVPVLPLDDPPTNPGRKK
jgi:hypothetical protein